MVREFVGAYYHVPLRYIPPLAYSGQALVVAWYITGGIRGVEIGSLMFGRQSDGPEKPASMELVRLALPRRVCTQSHVDYVIECFEHVNREKTNSKASNGNPPYYTISQLN
jgi:tryptophanase